MKRDLKILQIIVSIKIRDSGTLTLITNDKIPSLLCISGQSKKRSMAVNVKASAVLYAIFQSL